jgi:hypothetical protein
MREEEIGDRDQLQESAYSLGGNLFQEHYCAPDGNGLLQRKI